MLAMPWPAQEEFNMLTYKDAAMLDDAFSNLNQTLLRNRMMKLEQQRSEQNATDTQAYRNAELGYRKQGLSDEAAQRVITNKAAQDTLNERIRADKATEAANQQNEEEKGSKIWYFISPATKNVWSFLGTASEANQHLSQLQAKAGNDQIEITDKEPDGLKDLNQIPIDDKNTLHASDAEAVRYYTGKINALAPKTTTTTRTGVEDGYPIDTTNTTTMARAPLDDIAPAITAPLSGPAPNPNARMKVKSPTGKVGTVPQNQLQDAIEQGYTQVP
jgi:hypothetical protein